MPALSTDRLPARSSSRRLLLASPKDYVISPLPASPAPLQQDTVIELRLYARGLKNKTATLTLSSITAYPPFLPKSQTFTLGDTGWITKSFTLTVAERQGLLGGMATGLYVSVSCGELSTISESFTLATATDCDCGAALQTKFPADTRGKNLGPVFAGTRWADEFDGWKLLLQDGRATPDEVAIIIGVAFNEGKLDQMQANDSEILSVGIMQKTLKPDADDGGQLAKQLYDFQQANPARFACLLGNCGWQVTHIAGDNCQASYTDPTDPAKKKVVLGDLKTLIRKPHQRVKGEIPPPTKNVPLQPFVRLLQDRVFQEQQVLDFIKMLHEVLQDKPVDRIKKTSTKISYDFEAGQYLQSPLGRTLLLDQKVNRDTQPMSYLGKALTKFYLYEPNYWLGLGASTKPANNPADWSAADRRFYEQELIKIYGPLRGTIIETAESGAHLYFKGIESPTSRFNTIRCYFILEHHLILDWLPALPVRDKETGKMVIKPCTSLRKPLN